jgi:cellulose synthase/poly-beta-1,6-N-acetylglucosamine synthase-like glycosyltransferase
VIFIRGVLSIPDLGKAPARVTGPLVSIIFAAKDEGPNIEQALGSMLAQSYEKIEYIAVNDRSTDDTGAVLDRMAGQNKRLRVIHVTELPAGWLGKNHALQAGAAIAGGEYLLFTDADIHFDRDAIARAVPFMEANGIDHLTLGPELDSPSPFLELVVSYFTLGFFLLFRPWLVADSRRQEHVGIGAFNLIRASFYRKFGGHERIALRPDDDIKLGRLVKINGGRQMIAHGFGVIRVRWYSTVMELVRGLRKNTFAGMKYSVAMTIGALVMQLVVNIWPFIAVFVTTGPTRWLNLASAALLMLLLALISAGMRGRIWIAIGYPLAAIVFMFILIDSTWRTLRRGGIEWRGTFYPLAALKGNDI